jgi:hypothetical protein
MVAGHSKGPDRNQKPSTSTSTITVIVDVNVDVLVHVDVDVFFKSNRGVIHIPENVKLLLPPGQSTGCYPHVRLWVWTYVSCRILTHPTGCPKGRQSHPIRGGMRPEGLPVRSHPGRNEARRAASHIPFGEE